METDMEDELMVSLRDVWQVCEIVRAVPLPIGETAAVRNEAVGDVFMLLEQLAMSRALDWTEQK